MSRSSFWTRSNSNSSHDDQNNPLLHTHSHNLHQRRNNNNNNNNMDIHLQDIESRATPSPPPSFYRDLRSPSETTSGRRSSFASAERRERRDRDRSRKIQFLEPPRPVAVAGSMVVGGSVGGLDGERSGSGRRGGGKERVVAGQGKKNDTLLGLERRERAIQMELQELLDAQSAGLVMGFGGRGGGAGLGDGNEGSGSSTPTTRSLSLQRERDRGRGGAGDIRGTVPVRQPKKKIVGLRAARKGLLRDMGELVGVKEEEGMLLVEEIERREECIEKVRIWKARIEEVRREIGEFVGVDTSSSSNFNDTHGERLDVESSSGGKSEEDLEIAELQTEEKAVELEIREMEDRLLQMRARKNWLGERIKERVNQRESRLSSYRGALREVEGEVREFLTRPPVMISMGVNDEEESFMRLPPKRRTLEMAEEWWGREIERLRGRKGEVEREREALEEGRRLWGECMGRVMGFEDELRGEMRRGDGDEAGVGINNEDVLRKQVAKMKEVVESLEEKVKVAEEKGWNLLVCAVGAEAAAFKEGMEILKGALGEDSVDDDEGKGIHDVHDDDDDDHSINTTTSTDHDEDDNDNDNDTTTDDGLKELENDLARQEGLLLGNEELERECEREREREHGGELGEESDEEKHLKELLVDHDDGF